MEQVPQTPQNTQTPQSTQSQGQQGSNPRTTRYTDGVAQYTFNGKNYNTKEEAVAARDTYKAAVNADWVSVGKDRAKYDALIESGRGLSQMSDDELGFIRDRYSKSDLSKRKEYTKSGTDAYLFSMGLPSSKEINSYRQKYIDYMGNGGIEQHPELADKDGNLTDASKWIQKQWEKDNAEGLGGETVTSGGKDIKYEDTYLDDQLKSIGLPPSARLNEYFLKYKDDKAIDDLVDEFYSDVYKNGQGANAEDAFRETLGKPKYSKLAEYWSEPAKIPTQEQYTDTAKYDKDYKTALETNAKREEMDHRVSYDDYSNYAARRSAEERRTAQEKKYKEINEKAYQWYTKPATTPQEKRERENDMRNYLNVYGGGDNYTPYIDEETKEVVDPVRIATESNSTFRLLDLGMSPKMAGEIYDGSGTLDVFGLAAAVDWNNSRDASPAEKAEVAMILSGASTDSTTYDMDKEVITETYRVTSSKSYDKRKSFDANDYRNQITGGTSAVEKVTFAGAVYALVNGQKHGMPDYSDQTDYGIFQTFTKTDSSGKSIAEFMTDDEKGTFNYLFHYDKKRAMKYAEDLSDMLARRRQVYTSGTYDEKARSGVIPETDAAQYGADNYINRTRRKLETIPEDRSDYWQREAWEAYGGYSDYALQLVIDDAKSGDASEIFAAAEAAEARGEYFNLDDAVAEKDKNAAYAQYILDLRKKAQEVGNVEASMLKYTVSDGEEATKSVKAEDCVDSEYAAIINGFWKPVEAQHLPSAEYDGSDSFVLFVNNENVTKDTWLSQMTSEEKNQFNWLLKNKGVKEADAYIDLIKSSLDDRAYNAIKQEDEAFAKEHPGAASFVSLLGTGFSGYASLSGTLLNAATGVKTTKAQTALWDPSGIMTEAVSDVIASKVGQGFWGDAAVFGYQTTMSMAQSGMAAALSAVAPGAGGFMLASSAFASTLREGLDRGLDPDRATVTAFLAGVAEMFFEEVSLEKFITGVKGAKDWRTVLENIAKQSFTEGSEEFFTEVANIASDYLVNQDMSELQQKYDDYIDRGYTPEEANSLIAKDIGTQLGMATLGGAVSGGIMGGLGNIGALGFNSALGRLEKKAGIVRNEGTNFKEVKAALAPQNFGVKNPATTEQVRAIGASEKFLTRTFGKNIADQVWGQAAVNNISSERIDTFKNAITQDTNTNSYLWGITHDGQNNISLSDDELTSLAACMAALTDEGEANPEAAYIALMAASQSETALKANNDIKNIKSVEELNGFREAIQDARDGIEGQVETLRDLQSQVAEESNDAMARENESLQRAIAAFEDGDIKGVITALESKSAKSTETTSKNRKANEVWKAIDKARRQIAKNYKEISRQQGYVDKHFSSLYNYLAEVAPQSMYGANAAAFVAQNLKNETERLRSEISDVLTNENLSEKARDARLKNLNRMLQNAVSSAQVAGSDEVMANPQAFTAAINAAKNGNAAAHQALVRNKAGVKFNNNASSATSNASDTQSSKDSNKAENTASEDVKQETTQGTQEDKPATQTTPTKEKYEYKVDDRTQKAWVKLLKKRFGIDLIWVDSDTVLPDGTKLGNHNGCYIDTESESKKIFMNRTITSGIKASTNEVIAREYITHEMTHYIENTSNYVDLKRSALSYYRKLKGDEWVKNALKGIAQKRIEEGLVPSARSVSGEFVARFVQDVLFRENNKQSKALVWLTRQNKGVVGDMLTYIQYLIARADLRKSPDNELKIMLLDAEMHFLTALKERQVLDSKTSATEAKPVQTEDSKPKQEEPVQQQEEQQPVAEEPQAKQPISNDGQFEDYWVAEYGWKTIKKAIEKKTGSHASVLDVLMFVANKMGLDVGTINYEDDDELESSLYSIALSGAERGASPAATATFLERRYKNGGVDAINDSIGLVRDEIDQIDSEHNSASVEKQSTQEETVAEEPAEEAQPVQEETPAEKPVQEEPVSERQVAEEPVSEEVTEEVAEKPAVEEPVAEEKPAEEKTAPEEQPVEETQPVQEEPVAEQQTAEEPVAEEVTEEVAEEPIAEKQTVQEEATPVEQPVKERTEPVQEKAPAEQPVQDTASQQEETTPVQEETTPVQEETTPVQEEAQAQPAEQAEQPAPAQETTQPAQQQRQRPTDLRGWQELYASDVPSENPEVVTKMMMTDSSGFQDDNRYLHADFSPTNIRDRLNALQHSCQHSYLSRAYNDSLQMAYNSGAWSNAGSRPSTYIGYPNGGYFMMASSNYIGGAGRHGRSSSNDQQVILDADDVSTNNSFIDNVINYGYAVGEDESRISDQTVLNRERNTLGSDIQFSDEQLSKLYQARNVVGSGNQVVIAIPFADGFEGEALQALREIYKSIPQRIRPKIGFAVGVDADYCNEHSVGVQRYGADYSKIPIIITTESEASKIANRFGSKLIDLGGVQRSDTSQATQTAQQSENTVEKAQPKQKRSTSKSEFKPKQALTEVNRMLKTIAASHPSLGGGAIQLNDDQLEGGGYLVTDAFQAYVFKEAFDGLPVANLADTDATQGYKQRMGDAIGLARREYENGNATPLGINVTKETLEDYAKSLGWSTPRSSRYSALPIELQNGMGVNTQYLYQALSIFPDAQFYLANTGISGNLPVIYVTSKYGDGLISPMRLDKKGYDKKGYKDVGTMIREVYGKSNDSVSDIKKIAKREQTSVQKKADKQRADVSASELIANTPTTASATKGRVTYAFHGINTEGQANARSLKNIKESLTPSQLAKATFWEKIAEAMDVDLVIHDSYSNVDGKLRIGGWFERNGDNKVHVTLDGAALTTISHEFTHFMQYYAPEEYAELRQALQNEVGKKAFDDLVKNRANAYKLNMDSDSERQAADDEAVAKLCESMLNDPERIKRFVTTAPNAAQTLLDRLKKWISAIKAAIKSLSEYDLKRESPGDIIESQETVNKWISGLQTAINKYNETVKQNAYEINQMAGVSENKQREFVSEINNAQTEQEEDNIINQFAVDITRADTPGYISDLKTLIDLGTMQQSEVTDLENTMNEAISMVSLHRDILDFGGVYRTPEEIAAAKTNRAYKPYKENADPHYKLALDFSTLCRKRVLLQSIQERLQAKLSRALTQEETVAIRLELQKLQKEGYQIEVACALCYVEAARLKSPKVINDFLTNTETEMRKFFAKKNKDAKAFVAEKQREWKVANGYNENATKKPGKNSYDADGNIIPGMVMSPSDTKRFNEYSSQVRSEYQGTDGEKDIIKEAVRMTKEEPEQFLSAANLAKMKKEKPEIFQAFTDKVRAATRSKAQETDTFYARGDIDMVSDSVIEYANAESGFRHQSWSDFVPMHLLDTIASIIEMSTRKYTDRNGVEHTGAKMHAYTKVPDMVRFLGKTGMMLNMSLIPKGATGLKENGDLDFDSVEGMDYDTMLSLRDMFPETAGNIAIGISDEQIRKMLDSNEIDYVIPYHASGLNQTMRGYLDIQSWSEFTTSQNEKSKVKRNQKKPPALAEWFKEDEARNATDGYEYMRRASEEYIRLCNERKYVPKFAQYLTENADGTYSLNDEYKNYWKLLIDRKMVNHKTGKVIIQSAVKPIFDRATALGILQEKIDRDTNPDILGDAQAREEVVKRFSDWRADRNNADAAAIKEAKSVRNRAKTAAPIASIARSADMIAQEVLDNEDVDDRRYSDDMSLDEYAEAGSAISPSEDAAYMSLAERYKNGDTSVESELQDAVKRAASYSMKDSVVRENGALQIVYHGSLETFNKFDKNQIRAIDYDAPFNGFWFTSDENDADPAMRSANYVRAFYLNIKNPAPFHVWKAVSREINDAWFQEHNSSAVRDGARSLNDELRYRLQDMKYDGVHFSGAYNFDEANVKEYNEKGETTFTDASGRKYDLRKSEYGDARLYPHGSWNEIMPYETAEDFFADNNNEYRNADVWVAFEPEQIKSADPVTYRDNGEIIPLSERFNERDPDIRYSDDMSLDEYAEAGSSNTYYSDNMTLEDYAEQYGQKQQNPYGAANNIVTPERTSDTNRVSDSVQTLKQVRSLSQNTRDLIDSGVLEEGLGTYDPITLNNMRKQGMDYIAEHGGLSQAMRDLTSEMPNVKARDLTRIIAAANQVFYEIGSEGITSQEYADFVSEYVMMRSAWGRMGRAMQLVNDSPLGRRTYWEKVIKKINSQNKESVESGVNRLFYRKGYQKIEVPEIYFQELQEAQTQEEIDAAEYEITNWIGGNSPLTVGEALRNWRYLAMLANPVTHFRNMLGNLTMQAGRVAKDAIAAGIENIAVRRGVMTQNERTHAIRPNLSQEGKAKVEELYQQHKQAIQSGGRDGFSNTLRDAKRKSPFLLVDLLMQFNSQKLEDEDELFLHMTFKSAAAQIIAARGYDATKLTQEQTNEVVAYATQQAQEATYRDASKVADTLNQIAKSGWLAQLIVEGAVPFKKTPINIAKRGVLEYSPIGLARGIIDLGRNAMSSRRGNGYVISASKVADELGRGLAGSALALLGFFLSKAGILKISAGNDDRDSTFERDVGHQNYSIEIGNVSFKIDSLAPLTMPLFVGAALREEFGDGISLADFADTVAAIANPLMDMSFMSAINDALDTYDDNGMQGVLTNLAWSYASQYVPTFGGKLNNAFTPTRRTAKSAGDARNANADYRLRSMGMKVPGLSQAWLEPYVKTTGEYDVKDSGTEWVLSFMDNFLLPVNVQVIDTNPINEELARVVRVTGSTEFIPKNPTKQLTINGEPRKLSAKEYTEYSKDHNESVYGALADTIRSNEYAVASEEDRAAMLEKAYSSAHRAAMKKWQGIYGSQE